MCSLVVWKLPTPLYLPLKRGGPVCLPIEEERCIIEKERCKMRRRDVKMRKRDVKIYEERCKKKLRRREK